MKPNRSTSITSKVIWKDVKGPFFRISRIAIPKILIFVTHNRTSRNHISVQLPAFSSQRQPATAVAELIKAPTLILQHKDKDSSTKVRSSHLQVPASLLSLQSSLSLNSFVKRLFHCTHYLKRNGRPYEKILLLI